MTFPADFGTAWQQLLCTLGSEKLFLLQRGSSETQRPWPPWEVGFRCSISLLWTCWAKYTKG